MCDLDGCSSTTNLTHYEGDVDLCEWHTYLAKKMGLTEEREKKNYTKEEDID